MQEIHLKLLFSADHGFRHPSSASSGSFNPYQSPTYDSEEQDAEQAGPPLHRGILWILFSFEGRIPRRVFWATSIVNTLVYYAAASLLIVIFGEQSDVAGIGIAVLYIPMIWVSLAVTAKRWHDRDKRGWWILISFVPIIGPIWQFIETGCLRGTVGPNRFGADPTGDVLSGGGLSPVNRASVAPHDREPPSEECPWCEAHVVRADNGMCPACHRPI